MFDLFTLQSSGSLWGKQSWARKTSHCFHCKEIVTSHFIYMSDWIILMLIKPWTVKIFLWLDIKDIRMRLGCPKCYQNAKFSWQSKTLVVVANWAMANFETLPYKWKSMYLKSQYFDYIYVVIQWNRNGFRVQM